MKWLIAIAAFLMASTAAQAQYTLAQYTFEYGGRTIRIDPDRGTVSIPGVYDNTGRPSKRSRNDQDSSRKQTPDQAKIDPQPTAPAPAPAEPAAASDKAPPQPSSATANVAPAEISTPAQPPAAAPSPPIQQNETPAAKSVAPPVVATAPPVLPAPAPPAPAAPAVQSANSPLGVWLTEEKEGKVRIEQCGANLCGYSVDPKSSKNGEQVLINMKPGKDSKWSGRIFDPNTGSTYDSTIALKGSDTLRVQGCAFGGMFCGGQTWSRLN
jgi:uncharacterized protein (DUF2147 family)